MTQDGIYLQYVDVITMMRKYAEAQLKESKWISVNDKLPETFRHVLVWQPENKNIRRTYYRDGKWQFDEYSQGSAEIITHWMPLPEAPKTD